MNLTIFKGEDMFEKHSSPVNAVPDNLQGMKFTAWQPVLLWLVLLSVWFLIPGWLRVVDPTVAIVDQGIWLLIILSLITFLIIMAISLWLLHLFWQKLGLPSLSSMVSQFKTLEIWQQLAFFWASFALVLLAALVCLTAIC